MKVSCPLLPLLLLILLVGAGAASANGGGGGVACTLYSDCTAAHSFCSHNNNNNNKNFGLLHDDVCVCNDFTSSYPDCHDPCEGVTCGAHEYCSEETGACFCQDGYEWDFAISDSCLDIDECATSTTNDCDEDTHICRNTPGSYVCDEKHQCTGDSDCGASDSGYVTCQPAAASLEPEGNKSRNYCQCLSLVREYPHCEEDNKELQDARAGLEGNPYNPHIKIGFGLIVLVVIAVHGRKRRAHYQKLLKKSTENDDDTIYNNEGGSGRDFAMRTAFL